MFDLVRKLNMLLEGDDDNIAGMHQYIICTPEFFAWSM